MSPNTNNNSKVLNHWIWGRIFLQGIVLDHFSDYTIVQFSETLFKSDRFFFTPRMWLGPSELRWKNKDKPSWIDEKRPLPEIKVPS